MTAHTWYRPPIPDPPMVCEACGVNALNMDAPPECPGEPEHTDPPEPTSAGEIHRAAWHQHEEAHR